MNKKFIVISLLSLIIGSVYADNKFTAVTPQEVPQGERGNLIINYNFDNEGDFSAYSLQLVLPEGVTMIDEGEGYEVVGGNCNSNSHGYAVNLYEGVYYLTCSSTQSAPFKGTSGVLMTIPVNVSNELELNKEYPVQIKNVKISYLNATSISMDDVDFNIKVVENRIELDENATELPNVTGLQNVLVKRTIKKDQWNTICLPFAMTAKQVTDAFGEDVKLADFIGCTVEQAEDAEYASSIQVNFQSVTEMAANRPYLIKVLNPISYEEGFKVDDVTVEPNDAPVNAQDEYEYTYKVGSRWVTDYYYNSFYGTYVANTEIPAGSIILSGNKFYYTKGTTTKGFRGWFSFDNCALDDIDLAYAAVKIFIDDDVTVIDGIDSQRNIKGVYDLSGRKIKVENNDLNTLQKGVYIIDGKKVTIK